MKRNLVILIVMLMCSFVVRSQSFDLQNTQYGVEEGLPSPETYFTYQDSDGYIWIGTDRGLARFDGYRFKTFTRSNSNLTFNTVFKVFPAPNGELWFTCYDGSITIYNVEKHEFRAFVFNDTIRQWNDSWVNTVWFRKDSAYLSWERNSILEAVVSSDEDKIYLKSIDYSSWQKVNNTQLVKFDLKDSTLFYHYTLNEYSGPRIVTIQNKVGYKKWTVKFSQVGLGDTICFSKNNRIFKTYEDREELVHSFQEKEVVQHLYADNQGRILVATTEGFYYVTKGVAHKLLEGNFTFISQDQEKNYWLASHENGIYRIPDIQERPNSLSLEQGRANCLKSFGGVLVIGTNKEALQYIDSSSETKNPQLCIANYIDWVRDVEVKSLIENNGRLLTSGGLEILMVDKKLQARIFHTRSLKGIEGTVSQANLYLKGGAVVSSEAMPGYVVYPKFGEFKWYRGDANVDSRVTCLDQDNSGVVWLTSIKGVWRIDGEDLLHAEKVNIYSLSERVNVVKHTSSDVIIFGTGSNGILLYKNSDTLLLGESEGLAGNAVNSMALEGDSVLWVGTDKGISKVIIAKDFRYSHIDYCLNSDDGLANDYVYALEVWNNNLWVGFNDKLQCYSLNQLRPELVRPKILIEAVSSRKRLGEHLTSNVFENYENDLVINYVGISYRKPRKDFYRYRLIIDGQSSGEEYNFTDNTSVDLFNLAPGSYVFEIACRDKNNTWSETKTYSFTVTPHFTDTLWFRILTFGGSVTLIILISLWRIREIRRKNTREGQLRELEYKFKESELAILRNQMNPHFVFNALNSIQSYVLDNDIATASGYLQKFSVLMRSSLEYSMDDLISLEKEVQFLGNYLQIERLRFPGRFDYAIEVSDEVDVESVEIPPLLIQPIVENCVKHAFRPDEKKGLIRIIFEEEGDVLKCTVEDNGIGIEKSRENSSVSHRSYGMQVVKNRLELLSTEEFKLSLEIVDLSKEDSNKTGTRVVIKIPFE